MVCITRNTTSTGRELRKFRLSGGVLVGNFLITSLLIWDSLLTKRFEVSAEKMLR